MEIEAKFAVPDAETCQRLQATDRLAGFALSTGQIKQVRDTYMDTAGRLLLAAGYACRRRERGDRVVITLKGLGGAVGAVHRREELEVEVMLPVAQRLGQGYLAWPAGPLRERVLELIGDSPLTSLFELHQARNQRLVSQGQRVVAEWSLDDVRVVTQGREQTYVELEVELAPQGTEDDLAAIAASLQDEWGLTPEPRSKFERALALAEEAPPEGGLLTPRERAISHRIAARDDLYGRRADALLALDQGATQSEAAERANRSARTVRRWLSGFRRQRLDTFPARILAAATPTPASPQPQPTPEPESLPEAQESPRPLALETLFERYGVDTAHARAVADHALALFDHLLPFHGLPPERRSLVETAALVHNVGLETDPNRHHVVGRDILLDHPPAGLDDFERQVVALTTYLHRKRITPRKLEKKLSKAAFARLPESAQAEALAMAALVRMADGLDYSQTGSSRLGDVQRTQDQVAIEVKGPHAAVDATRAQRKSDLWHLLFEADLQFRPAQMALFWNPSRQVQESEQPAEQAIPAAPEKQELPRHPGLLAGDTMAEAARKTFAFHFQRMLYHEPGTRLGEDIEELHDMRVATRRMRAAFRVFGDYLDVSQLRPIRKGLRRTGGVLGAVRDLDVFWDKTRRYLDALPPAQQRDLDPLRQVWEAERERARGEMLAYLDGDRYARFKDRFAEYLQSPGAGALPALSNKGEAIPRRLQHVVPVVVYQRLAGVQAYDEWVTRPDVPLERLHRLRIAAKRLRYTLEFFREVLAPEAERSIKEIKGLQDHLGDLQDAVVASGLLRDFLTWGTWGHAQARGKEALVPTAPIVAPGVATYLAARQIELQNLLDTFPQAWARIHDQEFSRLAAASLTALSL